MKDNLGLIVLANADILGGRVQVHLNNIRKNSKDYRIAIENSRFANGEGKIKLLESVRGKDLYIISDVGNYSTEYSLHGKMRSMGPDEHFSDIKRVIAATSSHAKSISLIMPLLYQSRQHKRKGRESLDCALALQELQYLGVKNLVTFDAHDPSIDNAVPRMDFQNFYPTDIILNTMLQNEGDDMDNFMVISPDMGALERARYYADMIGSDLGFFYKRRDLSRVVDGKNPIIEHTYLGGDLHGKNVAIVDDMIASGGSIIDVAHEAKKRGANKVYLVATFSLFTEGVGVIKDAYRNGYFDKLYTTNLSYIPKEVKIEPWYNEVDCSLKIARIIDSLNRDESLQPLHDEGKQAIKRLHL